jgi:ubiquinone/menaquinone biosynthesis C-methylase UbiE
VTDTANTDQYQAWNGDSGHRWVLDADRRDHILAPVAGTLLAAAHLSAGEAVVDIGCGCGATTLAAAQVVGSTGAVYGIDLSEPMLGVARRRAEASGLANITLVQGDVQTHRFPARFDAAFSRFATMFCVDQTAALANIRRGLRPGGRLCLATWQPLEANDWLTIPGAALLRYGDLPDTRARAPGMFAQSDAENVATTLRAAGYADPQLAPVTLTLTLGADPNEAVNYLADTGPGRAVLDSVHDDQRPAALAAVRGVLADHTQPDGVQLGAAIWIVSADNPT